MTWQTVLDFIQTQTDPATFEQHLRRTQAGDPVAGRLTVATPSEASRAWLDARLRSVVERAAASVYGVEVEIEFVADGVVGSNWSEEYVVVDAPEVDTPDPAAGAVAGADHVVGFFERGGAGYSQIAHHTTFFRMPLLGRAFLLWKSLDSDDKRPLKSIAPNFWTPPNRYSFDDLVQRLNQKRHHIVTGGPRECYRTYDGRRKSQPVTCPAGCCWGSDYRWVRHRPFPKGGSKCEHWSTGLLEILCQQKLARVHFLSSDNYKPEIQIWRMPSLLTPYLYERMEPLLQKDYDLWLDQYLVLFGLKDRREWATIRHEYLEPLMPGYDQYEIDHNYEIYGKWRSFIDNATENPNYDGDQNFQTTWSENSENSDHVV